MEVDDQIWRIVIGMDTRFPVASLAVSYSVRLGFAMGESVMYISWTPPLGVGKAPRGAVRTDTPLEEVHERSKKR